jgi:RND superfamily putative drug exporter
VAKSLYRVGRWVAAHAGRVLIVWAVVLVASVGLVGVLKPTLSPNITLNDIPAQQVVDDLQQSFPVAARGSGQVVFQTTDGQPFTEAQKEAVASALTAAAAVPGVADVTDPFAAQAKLDDAKKKVADGTSTIADNTTKLDSSQRTIDEGRAKLATAKADLSDGQAKADAGAKELASAEAELQANQAKADAGAKELASAKAELQANQAKADAGAKELASAEAELQANQKQIDAGRTQVAATSADLAKKEAALQAALDQATAAGAPQSTIDGLNASLAQVRAGQQQVAQKSAELDAGQKTLDAGRATLAKKQAELTAAQKKLDAGRATLAKKQAELDAGQKTLDAGRATLAKKQAELTAAQKKLDAGRATLTDKERELADAQTTVDDGRAKIESARADLAASTRLLAATSGFRLVSTDGATAIGVVEFDQSTIEVDPSTREAAVAAISDADIPGVQVEFSKELVSNYRVTVGAGEILGLAVAAVVLFVMLGTLIGAGLPVLSALVGVGVSASLAMALATKVDMTSTTPVLGIMLGLAVGIDYSLFILNRHRRQLKAGVEVQESVGLATGTSGTAVLFAGTTVVIALLALNLSGMQFLGLMGTVGAFAIVVAVLAALTFTPAVLALAKHRVLTRKERAALAARQAATGDERAEVAPRDADRPVLPNRHPWLTIIGASILVLVAAIPAAGLRLGLPDGSAESANSTQYRAYKEIGRAFGVGANGPIVAVVTMPAPIAADDTVTVEADLADRIMALDNVAAAVPAAVSDDGTKVMFQIIPTTSPSSVETEQLVHAVRDLAGPLKADLGADIGVTGVAAANIDISERLNEAMPLYLGTVILLSLVLLVAVFRSIAVPVLASAGFLATVLATFGIVVAVYQHGWMGALFGVHDPGPILSFLPIILIGVLFGLAMDYQLFLTSGIREAHVHGKSPSGSINYGIHLSRSVVIAAATIMIFVFGGFIFSELAVIRPIGFGLAVGVLIDAFVVRLMIVPAVLTLLGKWAWWIPRWLDKILPNLDVEGAALEREHLH